MTDHPLAFMATPRFSRRRMLALLLATPALLAGCAQGVTQAAPPEIRYGQDLCAECGMIIGDPRLAAGLAHEVESGRYESLAFDDIGELLAYVAKHPELQIVGWYVHDYVSEEWLEAALAYY